MPRLGLSMVEGTVTEWRLRPGDPVEKGQIVLTIESEKAEVEVEAFESGVLAHTYVETGTTVPIGSLLGAITGPGETFDAAAFAAAFVPAREGAPATAASSASGGAGREQGPDMRRARAMGSGGLGRQPSEGGAAAHRLVLPHGVEEPPSAQPASAGEHWTGPRSVKSAPAARALAKKLGLDLSTLTGSGPGGRILPEDVEAAAASRVPVGGALLAASASGEGPPILLINGFAVDATGWRRQVDGLSASHRVIVYDARGIGDSQPLGPMPLTIERLAADAVAVLDRFAQSPATVVGASMGAAVALELALAAPDRVRGLVLLTPVFGRDERLAAILRSWAEISDAAARAHAMLPWIVARDFLADTARREATLAALRAMSARISTAALAAHRDALLEWLGGRKEDLGRITRPTSILAGAEDLLSPPAEAEALARALGNAKVEVLAGAGHGLMIEQPDRVNERIRSFAAA